MLDFQLHLCWNIWHFPITLGWSVLVYFLSLCFILYIFTYLTPHLLFSVFLYLPFSLIFWTIIVKNILALIFVSFFCIHLFLRNSSSFFQYFLIHLNLMYSIVHACGCLSIVCFILVFDSLGLILAVKIFWLDARYFSLKFIDFFYSIKEKLFTEYGLTYWDFLSSGTLVLKSLLLYQ